MKRLVIVGNGAGVLKSENGPFINASDVVVRLNNFKIEGFEKHVGTKTDIYSCTPKWLRFVDMPDEERLSITEDSFKNDFASQMTPEEAKERRDSFFRIYSPPKIESAKTKVISLTNETFDQNYSTGMRTILHCLNHFPDHQIFIVGFDCFFSSGWYWDDKYQLSDAKVRTENFNDGHPYLMERTMLQRMVACGKVTRLD